MRRRETTVSQHIQLSCVEVANDWLHAVILADRQIFMANSATPTHSFGYTVHTRKVRLTYLGVLKLKLETPRSRERATISVTFRAMIFRDGDVINYTTKKRKTVRCHFFMANDLSARGENDAGRVLQRHRQSVKRLL